MCLLLYSSHSIYSQVRHSTYCNSDLLLWFSSPFARIDLHRIIISGKKLTPNKEYDIHAFMTRSSHTTHDGKLRIEKELLLSKIQCFAYCLHHDVCQSFAQENKTCHLLSTKCTSPQHEHGPGWRYFTPQNVENKSHLRADIAFTAIEW